MNGAAAPATGVAGAIERGIDLVTRGLAALGAAALAGILVLMLASVVRRYVWSAPFGFSEELSGLLLGVAVFALMPYTVARELNIRVTVLSARLGGPAARLAHAAGQAVLIGFAAVFAWQTWQISEFTLRLGLRSEQARLPLAPFLILTTTAVVLVAVAGFWRILRPLPRSDAPPV